MGISNPLHIAFIALVALLVLGPKRLPEVARSLGNGMREFRESLSAAADNDETPAATHAIPVAQEGAQQAVAEPAVAPVAAAPPAPAPAESAPAAQVAEPAVVPVAAAPPAPAPAEPASAAQVAEPHASPPAPQF